jgi:hypothetical protein
LEVYGSLAYEKRGLNTAGAVLKRSLTSSSRNGSSGRSKASRWFEATGKRLSRTCVSSRIVLSDEFYLEITAHPIPTDLETRAAVFPGHKSKNSRRKARFRSTPEARVRPMTFRFRDLRNGFTRRERCCDAREWAWARSPGSRNSEFRRIARRHTRQSHFQSRNLAQSGRRIGPAL